MKRRSLFRKSVMSLGLAASALAPLAASAAEACTASQLEMPIEMVGHRAIVKVSINGTPARLLVDSGAFFSQLSPALANQLKLKLGELPVNVGIEGVTGEMEARLTTVEHLQIQGSEIPNVQFIVGGNEPGAGAQGLLGRNLLTNADIEYDLANGTIRLFFPKGDCSEASFAYWAGDRPYAVLPLMREDTRKRNNKRPPIRAFATLNGERIEVLFDTGAPTSLLAYSAAKRAGVTKEQMKAQGLIHGVGQGSVSAWDAKFDSFALAEERIANVHLEVADVDLHDAEMLIGADFFLAHRIYVSRLQQRMYFTHNGGPVFAPDAPAAPSAARGGERLPDAAAYARRGAGSAARHDYAAALADLDQACALAPDQPDYLVRRGGVHLALHQVREALADYDAALRLDPKLTEALLSRAELQPVRTGRDAALADLKTLDAALPPQAPERLRMAQIYVHFEQPREAIAELTHYAATRETDVHLPEMLSWRCSLRTQLGIELDQALADCDRAIDADGKNVYYRENRGLLRLKRGEPDRALADFDKALELKADAPWALYGRAIVRRQRGQTEAGRVDLDAARKLRPQVDSQLAKFGLPSPG